MKTTGDKHIHLGQEAGKTAQEDLGTRTGVEGPGEAGKCPYFMPPRAAQEGRHLPLLLLLGGLVAVFIIGLLVFLSTQRAAETAPVPAAIAVSDAVFQGPDPLVQGEVEAFFCGPNSMEFEC